MKITDINPEKHCLSFSARSVTVKSRSDFKTCGVIRDAVRLAGNTDNMRRDFEICKNLMVSGLDWHDIGLDRILYHNGTIYILHDTRTEDRKKENPALYEIDNAAGRMDGRIERDAAIMTAAEAAGYTVIRYRGYKYKDNHNYHD